MEVVAGARLVWVVDCLRSKACKLLITTLEACNCVTFRWYALLNLALLVS